MDANIESLYNLEENLDTQGYDLKEIPYVLQLNKRDLPNVTPIEELSQELTRKGNPSLKRSRPTAPEFLTRSKQLPNKC